MANLDKRESTMDKLADAVDKANGKDTEEPWEYVDWRDVARRMRLNTPDMLDQDCGPLRPVTPVDVNTLTLTPDNNVGGYSGRLDFGQRVRQVTIQNNTGAAIARRYLSSASGGALNIAAGQTVEDNVFVDHVWLWCATAQTVNGPLTGGIVVEAGS